MFRRRMKLSVGCPCMQFSLIVSYKEQTYDRKDVTVVGCCGDENLVAAARFVKLSGFDFHELICLALMPKRRSALTIVGAWPLGHQSKTPTPRHCLMIEMNAIRQ